MLRILLSLVAPSACPPPRRLEHWGHQLGTQALDGLRAAPAPLGKMVKVRTAGADFFFFLSPFTNVDS